MEHSPFHVKRDPQEDRWDLSMELFRFSEHEKDAFRLQDACAGVGTFGSTGTGKTSTTAKLLAKAYMSAGFGGLVLCGKSTEAEQWIDWAKEVRREQSIIHVHPDSDMVFPFLDYVSRLPYGGDVENLLGTLNKVIELTQGTDSASQGDNAFFYQASDALLRNALTLCKMTIGSVSLSDLYDIIDTAPVSEAERDSESWQENSFCFKAVNHCIEKEKQKSTRQNNYVKNRELELCISYFLGTYARMGDRLRSSVTQIFISSIDPWLRGNLYQLFSRKADEVDLVTGKKPFYLDPHHSIDGAIYIFDYSIKRDGLTAKIATALYKLFWQGYMERRDITTDGGRPCFLFGDEAQLYLNSDDIEFAQTARSSRVLTVWLTQNISNLYVALGKGNEGQHQADSLLGNLNTLIWHANSHIATNQWASTVCGSQWQYSASTSVGDSNSLSIGGQSGGNVGSSNSVQVQEQQRAVLEPREFTLLARGGTAYSYQVDAIIHQSGRIWEATDNNYIKVTYDQRDM